MPNRDAAEAGRRQFRILILIALALGAALAMSRLPATLTPMGIAPLGNDAFYHAARMLAIAAEPGSTHAFDPLVHWPDGTWLVWPWAYDYVLGAVAGLLADEREGIMLFLIFTPLAWLAGSIVLCGLFARRVLGAGLLAVFLVVFAVNPMTLSLHSVGAIDHHSVELFWTLAALLGLVLWTDDPRSRTAAALLGIALGAAPAFHNGLFILQVPVLVTLILVRLRFGVVWPRGPAVAFAVSLVLTQVLVLLPSARFRAFEYAFYFLSWFHLHAAVLTAIGALACTGRRVRSVLGGLLVGILGAVPALGQFGEGVGFVRRDMVLLKDIVEANSPYRVDRSARQVTRFYTALIWVAPLLIAYGIYRLIRMRRVDARLPVLVFAVPGLAMLLLQVRFFPYGLTFLFLLPLLFVQDLKLPEQRRTTIAAALMVVSFVFSWTYLIDRGPPGRSERWAAGWPVLTGLGRACEDEPGPLLAHQNWGNLVRYHTRCPVIANNFILTPDDAAAIFRSQELLDMTPDELMRAEPALRYILVSRFEGHVLTRSLMTEGPTHPRLEVLGESRNATGELLVRSYRILGPGH